MKSNNGKRVLITGMRAPAALELSRLFSSDGYDVYGADSSRFPIGRFSNTVSKYYRVPAPRGNHKGYIQKLIEIIIDENIDLLIPTCEEVFYVSRHKSLIEEFCQVACCDFDLITRLHNKYEFTKLSDHFDIKSPISELIESKEDLKNISDSNVVIKPAFSRFASNVLVKPTEKEIQGVSPSPYNPWVKQQFIDGDEYCVYAIANNGKLRAISCYRSNYTAGQGASIYFKAEPADEMEHFTKEFVEQYQYHGQISFDFIRNQKGQIFVIECNPRATSGIHLFKEHSTIPSAFIDQRLPVAKPDGSTSRMVGLAMVIYGLKTSIKANRFSQWHIDVKRADDVIFSSKDIVPYIGQFLSLGEYMLMALRSFKSLSAASTHDIEWNGEKLT